MVFGFVSTLSKSGHCVRAGIAKRMSAGIQMKQVSQRDPAESQEQLLERVQWKLRLFLCCLIYYYPDSFMFCYFVFLRFLLFFWGVMFFQIFFIFFMMLQQNTHRWFKFSFRSCTDLHVTQVTENQTAKQLSNIIIYCIKDKINGFPECIPNVLMYEGRHVCTEGIFYSDVVFCRSNRHRWQHTWPFTSEVSKAA